MRVIDVSGNGPLRAQYYSRVHVNRYVVVVHEAKAIPQIQRIVYNFNPELIIELGTSWGGITLVLHECNTKAKLHSYDINCPRKPDKSLFNKNVHFHIKDILTTPSTEIIDLCRKDCKKILYCDNGKKIEEVKLYGSELNKGDMLGVHDWGKEIKYEDVEEVLVNFEPIEHDLFEKKKWSTRLWKKIN